jgi:hypothetical protein
MRETSDYEAYLVRHLSQIQLIINVPTGRKLTTQLMDIYDKYSALLSCELAASEYQYFAV